MHQVPLSPSRRQPHRNGVTVQATVYHTTMSQKPRSHEPMHRDGAMTHGVVLIGVLVKVLFGREASLLAGSDSDRIRCGAFAAGCHEHWNPRAS